MGQQFRRFASGLTVQVVREPHDRTRFTYFLEATDATGRQWGQYTTNPNEAEVEKELAALPDDFHPRTHNPENDWQPAPPAYGSAAWGPEDEYRLACDEADAFGERRPDPLNFR